MSIIWLIFLKACMKIIDTLFSHCLSAGSPHNDINMPFLWERYFETFDDEEVIVITESQLYKLSHLSNCKKLILWVLESPAVVPGHTKEFIIKNFEMFCLILTHDDELKKLPNALDFPVGGCWIYEKDRKVYEKNIKKPSLILSHKKDYYGQILRHMVAAENLTDNFGFNFKKLAYKLEALKNYKYHICIENFSNNSYFSEKLIDCFATGTIPIYWGCKSIDKYFNPDGVISVDTFFELKFVLQNIEFVDIDEKIIQENFELSKQFWLPEDRILSLVNGLHRF